MLRLIHNQTCSGAILVDDIDDGLPNKNVHRLGSTADPKAYKRDGYATKPKQPCYVPRTKLYPVADPTIPGYIDLEQTDRVTLSAGKGKIKGLQMAGLIQVVSFAKADLAVPVVTLATINVPGAGDLTITGTKFLSLTPNYTSVTITGAGACTLTEAEIVAGGGSISDISIVIKAGSFPAPIASPGSAAQVTADDKRSNVVAV